MIYLKKFNESVDPSLYEIISREGIDTLLDHHTPIKLSYEEIEKVTDCFINFKVSNKNSKYKKIVGIFHYSPISNSSPHRSGTCWIIKYGPRDSDKCYICINKFTDDWYLLEFIHSDSVIVYYRCDTFDGLMYLVDRRCTSWIRKLSY